MKAAAGARDRWRVVALVFLILNIALSVNFAAYGALVGAIQEHYRASRALASSGLSMLTLSLGLLSPIVGGLMRRYSIRMLMAVGIVLNATGYLLIRWTSNIYEMLAIYALLVGPGFSLFSIVPCSTLIANWFDTGRGRAMGIINMPVGNFVMPIAGAALLSAQGLTATFTGGGMLLLSLLPLLLLFKDRPAASSSASGNEGDERPDAATALGAAAILRLPAFLILTLGVGVLSTGGLTMVTQIVSIGQESGLDVTSASLLLAGYGLAGVAGAPLGGWLSDRLGPGHAFAIIFFAAILPWFILLTAGGSFALLMLSASLIGVCISATMPLFGASAAAWIGAENISLGMGLSYMFQIPFMFGAGPAAGAIYDNTGSYAPMIILLCCAFAVTGAIFLSYAARRRAAISVAV